MSWANAVGAGIGAVGGALGSGGGTENVQPMENIPEFLRDDYRGLANQVSGLDTPQYYQGQQVAGMNPMMSSALSGMGGWGGGMGGDLMNSMYGGGMAGMNAMGQGMDYLNSVAGNGFQYDQGTYDQAFGNLSGGMQNAFDLGAQQMQQDFDWNMLPGLDMAAAMGGQQGSTKQYQQGALGQAMANQNIANFGSGLWQNAANQANSAAMTGGMQNLQNQNDMIGAYGNMAQLGSGMMGQAWNMGTGNLDMMLNGGQLQQGYDQSIVDADKAKWDYEQNIPHQFLATQMSMIPGPGGYTPGQAGMSPWEGAMQGAMGGVGFANAGQNAGWWGGGGSDINQLALQDWGPGGFSGGSAWDESF